MKYHLVVLGCQMNMSDSERVKSVIEGMGYTPTDNESEASLLGVLSCSVRQKPIDKVYSRIHKWNKQKNRQNLVTFVSGCVLPDDKKKFMKLFDFVFDMSELNDFPAMLSSYGVATPHSLNLMSTPELTNSVPEKTFSLPAGTLKLKPAGPQKPMMPTNQNIFELWQVKPAYESAFEAFVPIQNGCDKFCSYCAVPYTRGREVSRPSAEIVAEVKQLLLDGYKSITLLGQNVNSYGLDNPQEINFAQLLTQIGELGLALKSDAWVYYTSPHPRDMSRDVVEAMAKYPLIAKQVHLPLQSGDDMVLVKMNRKHNLDRYRESVAHIRELLPTATLFTDIIVGFTGETDEQFNNTITAFDEFKYNMAYIAMYSPRPGAQSFRWDDDIPKEVKKQRLQTLSDKLEAISLEYNNQLIDKEIKVLVRTTERKTGYLSGHTEGKIVTRILSKDQSLIGKFVTINVTGVSPLSITGKLTN
jgi:tRNA-2-methylthio-N6-dimethylallyladenosine synthase